MSKRNSLLVSDNLRQQILSESNVPGAVVADVARSHGISPGTLYGWRSEEKKPRTSGGSNNFVELSLPENNLPATSSQSRISKFSVTFEHCNLSLDGDISAECLSKILILLEKQC